MRRKIPLIAAALIGLLVFVSLYVRLLGSGASPEVEMRVAPAPPSAPSSSSSASPAASPPGPAASAAGTEGRIILDNLIAALPGLSSPDKRAALEAARRSLEELPVEESVRAVTDVLREGTDLSTGLPLKLGADGVVESPPTLRTYLLDVLGGLDSEDAASFAREVLDGGAPADELIVALRNYAWGTDEADRDPYFLARSRELLSGRSADRSSPAYLEGLDLVVFTKDVEQVPLLVELLAAGDGSASTETRRRAAFMALDRLAEAEFLGVASQLTGDSAGRISPALRAGILARADVRVEAERRLVESYLLSPGTTGGESAQFAKMFPLQSHFAGPTLLSAPPLTGELGDVIERDRASLAAVRSWKSDPRFAARAAEIGEVETRLERSLAVAQGSNGYTGEKHS